jgi:hypothetical protein
MTSRSRPEVRREENIKDEAVGDAHPFMPAFSDNPLQNRMPPLPGGGSMIRWYWPAAEVATGVRDIPPPDTKVSTDTLV